MRTAQSRNPFGKDFYCVPCHSTKRFQPTGVMEEKDGCVFLEVVCMRCGAKREWQLSPEELKAMVAKVIGGC
jgi:hypothetical protein